MFGKAPEASTIQTWSLADDIPNLMLVGISSQWWALQAVSPQGLG